jgi:hypothetical protein
MLLIRICLVVCCILLTLFSLYEPSVIVDLHQFRESNAAMSGLTESKERADEVYNRHTFIC